MVIGCSKRSGRDKDVSFYRILKIIMHRGKQDYELNKKRRNGFLAAVSREALRDKVVTNDRICSRHFILGKPASTYDQENPDWLPTLHLGHSKVKPRPTKEATERWERLKERNDTAARKTSTHTLRLRGDSVSETDSPLETDENILETQRTFGTKALSYTEGLFPSPHKVPFLH